MLSHMLTDTHVAPRGLAGPSCCARRPPTRRLTPSRQVALFPLGCDTSDAVLDGNGKIGLMLQLTLPKHFYLGNLRPISKKAS